MARSIIGTVVSDKADKTIVLSVTVRKTHPIYKKQFSRSTKYIAHDENNESRVGDVVEVVETRPISARKKLKLVKIISRAKIAEADRVENVTAEETEELKVVKSKVIKAETKTEPKMAKDNGDKS